MPRPLSTALTLLFFTLVAVSSPACRPRAGTDAPVAGPRPTTSPHAPPEFLTVDLDGVPAAEYTTDNDRAAGPLAARIHRRFPGIEVSSCLMRAAGGHASVDATLLEHLPLAFTEFALHWAGCPDPSATVSSLVTSDRGEEPLLDHLSELLDGANYTHVGLAKTVAPPPYTARWCVLLVDRRFEMRPAPSFGDRGEIIPLLFRLEGEFKRAAVAFTTPRGSTELIDAGLGGDWVVASVPLADDVGRQWIELIGYGPSGPQIVSLFPVEVGRASPRTWVGFPRPDESWIASIHQAESFVAALVNRDRERHGLHGLVADATLAQIAREHSLEMSADDYFAHISPMTGSVVDRLDAAGYAATFVAENIAMGALLAEAHESLLRSPGHRAAILSPDATHFGVGVASRNLEGFGRVHYVTQIFVRRPRTGLR